MRRDLFIVFVRCAIRYQLDTAAGSKPFSSPEAAIHLASAKSVLVTDWSDANTIKSNLFHNTLFMLS